MIVVTASGKIKADCIEEAKSYASLVVAASRNEPGCRAYVVGFAVNAPLKIFAYEEWETEESFAAHQAQPHSGIFLTSIAQVLESPLITKKIVTGDPEPL